MPIAAPDPSAGPSKSRRPARALMPIVTKVKTTLLNREVMTYLVFGVLTTALNYAVYFGLRQVISWPIANGIAWLVAVEFAYVTNRAIVFRSKGPYFKEMIQFYLSRLSTLGLESLVLFLMFDLAGAPEWLTKLFANVLVVIGNYILSKWIVFTRSRKTAPSADDGDSSQGEG